MTKYSKVALMIERRILSKQYRFQLPSEKELAKQYQTSRVVISRALKVLLAKDLVNVVQGSGIYVKKKNRAYPELVETNANEHDGYMHSMGQEGKVTSHVVSFYTRQPDEDEQQKLKIRSNDLVYDIIRQRLINGKASKLEYTVMPVKVIPGITQTVLHNSIYSYIQDNLKLKVGKADRVIMADRADAYDQDYLDCKPNDAVLVSSSSCILERRTSI